jgi:hypothetical protein
MEIEMSLKEPVCSRIDEVYEEGGSWWISRVKLSYCWIKVGSTRCDVNDDVFGNCGRDSFEPSSSVFSFGFFSFIFIFYYFYVEVTTSLFAVVVATRLK